MKQAYPNLGKEKVMEFKPIKPAFKLLFRAAISLGVTTHIIKVPLGEHRFIPITGWSFK
jgi:hypothetical protein